MKKFFVLIAPLLFTAVLFAHPDEPTAPDNKVLWHSVTVIDFKPGTLDNVKTLIHKFEAASETSGTDLPQIYWFESGKYDLVITWKLKNGEADFQGNWSPYGKTWWNALVQQEGSVEAARKLQSDYNDQVASSVTNIARRAQ